MINKVLILLSIYISSFINTHASFWRDRIDSEIIGSELNAFEVANNWISFLVGFLYFFAIIMILWAGFNVLTANGDDDKVKKSVSIIKWAVAWLIVIFLANSIVQWVLERLFTSAS